jgi:hypothetical protein
MFRMVYSVYVLLGDGVRLLFLDAVKANSGLVFGGLG